MSGSTGRFSSASRALIVTALALLAVVTTATSALAAAKAPNPIMSIYTGPGYHEHQGPGGEADVNICSYETDQGFAHCNARLRTDDAAAQSAGPPNARGASPSAVPSGSGYGPPDLQAAYNLASLSSTKGAGLTIAIVDAYDNPRAESDLANYRSAAGLPACTTANGCFRKVNQNGASSPLPTANKSWAQEISLDLDMASAICPKCNLLLVEATSNSFANLGTAVNRAATMGAVAISNSYGGSEFSSETSTDGSYFDHPGVAITASTGDSGYGVQYPAASPKVVAVGGTRLTKSGSTFSETAWSGAGSGCSQYEAKPAWQHDTGCARRTVADVSAVADPSTGVAVYDSYSGGSTWKTFGGTSVSAPIIAAVYALTYSGPYANAAASYAYGAGAGSLHDVTSGSNGSCNPAYLCKGGAGYDGPTGLGTPNGGGAFTSVAPTPDFSIGASPSSMTLNVNAGNSSTINLGALNGYSGNVTLSASVTSGSPSGLALTQPSSPAAVPSSSSSVGVTANTPGSYTVTVSATDGTLTHTTPIAVTVTGPNFSIATSPSSLSLAVPPSSGSSTINLAALNGYSGNLNLSAAVTSGSASGLTLTQPTSPVAATSNAATVGIAANTPGSYTVTVTATDTVNSALTHTATIAVTVASPTPPPPPTPPNFTVAATPMIQTVTHGQNATITVTISGSSMGPGGATLSVTGQNASDVVSWSVNPRTTAGTSVLTIKTSNTTGIRTLTIKAANGSYSRTATVYVLVN